MREMKKNILLLIVSFALLFGGNMTNAQEKNNKDLYNFGGHVFTGDFPITYGLAILYEASDAFAPIDTAIIDTLGYYYFYQKPEGKYLVLAGLQEEDPNYGQFSFTFYNNQAFWEEAEVIELSLDAWEYDIRLINQDPEQQINGPGLISGVIENLNGKPFAQNVDVQLFDENMNPLQHWASNSYGEFSFPDLDFGNYIVYPQVVGLSTHPIHISITPEQSTFSALKITIKDGQITNSIPEELIAQSSINLFPNPANNRIQLEFLLQQNTTNLQVLVYNHCAQIVYSQPLDSSKGFQELNLDVSHLLNGHYILVLQSDKGIISRNKVVVSH
ncbi:MAG: hypothetical protein B7C24_10765 [Bacteroidetes bacterium 4572_77]|nr:MAG: hypothetical protein B7C24_10765 [Bacteroidetes bacterium 4572_77]